MQKSILEFIHKTLSDGRKVPKDPIARWDQGRCPIHGAPIMGQVDRWYEENGRIYTIIGCHYNGCPVTAKVYDRVSGPVELMSEWKHLLNPKVEKEKDPIKLLVKIVEVIATHNACNHKLRYIETLLHDFDWEMHLDLQSLSED